MNFTWTEAVPDTNTNNNKMVTVNAYNSNLQVYQMSSNIFFDPNNGFVIFNTSTTLKIYNRKGNLVTDYSPGLYTTLDSVSSFTSWSALEKIGNKMVVYIAFDDKTILLVVEPGLNGISYNLFNSQKFDKNGVYYNTSSNTDITNNTLVDTTVNNTTSDSNDILKNAISDYYKWSFYWNTSANNGMNGVKSNTYSDDYMLKTQIVPPVCPACPSCPAVKTSGVCTNCGGNGGSGTQQSGYSDNRNTIGGVANNLIDTTGKGITSAATGATNLGTSAVTGTVGLAKDTVGGAVGLAKETVGGTVGLAKETVGGAVGLAKDTVGGAVNLAERAVSGIVNMGGPTQIPGNPYAQQRQGTNGQGMGINNYGNPSADIYSYYGAVPQRSSSNYMPISSDFSKFGR
jgi:hypothetical protein